MPGFFGFIEDTLFPKRCVSCGRLGSYVCAVCRKAVQLLDIQRCPMCDRPAMDGITHPKCVTTYGMDGLVGVFRYQGTMKKAIKAVKYRFASDMVAELTSLIPHEIFSRTIFERAEGLVPVPLHASRLKQRGFNQAEYIAWALSGRTGIPMRKDFLIRSVATRPQAELRDRASRLANMRSAFHLGLTPHNIKGKRLVLVDDVATTGATMRAAAATLKHAGVASVCGIALAR